MKAAVTTGVKREIIVKEIPRPEAQPGTLLLKTKYCSICGSDLEYLDGSYEFGTWGKLRAGAILGHEFSAEVVALGNRVKGWSVGDRVTVGGGLGTPCRQCHFCRRGLHHLCVGGDPRALIYDVIGGYGKLIGALSEYFVIPPGNLQRIPDHVSDEEAALVEPLATGVSVVEASQLKLGDSAVIIGAGKIGLGAMLCAKAAGVCPVIIIDLVESRLGKAKDMGADVILNPREVDVISEVVKLTETGSDAVFVCVRDGKVLTESVEMVRRAGTIAIAGFIPPLEVNPRVWVVKQLRFIGIQPVPGCLSTAMHLVANRIVDVKPIITEIIPLAEVQRGFNSIWSGKNIAVLVKP